MKSSGDVVSELTMRRERRIEITAGVVFSTFSVLILILVTICAIRLHEVVTTQGRALADVANPDLYLGVLQAGGGYAIWIVVLGFQAMQHFARAAQTTKMIALRCLLQELEARVNSTEGTGNHKPG